MPEMLRTGWNQPERRVEEKRVEPGKIIIAFKVERRCEMRK